AWYQLGKFDSASAAYAKYLALNPDCYASYRYAAFLYKSGDHDNAIIQCDKVINCDSNLVIVIYRIMGKCYLEKKTPDPAKALVYFNIFLRKQAQFGKPKLFADDYVFRGRALSKAGSDSLAIIDFQKALVMDTSKKEVYFDLGTSYYKMKKYGEAATWYKKKYDAEQNSSLSIRVTNLNAFAKSLYLNKEYARSDSAYAALITMDSTLTYGWLGRAQSNGRLDPDGAKESARPYYERYFQIATVDSVAKEKNKKELVNAALYLASIHLKGKNYACAKAYYLFVQGIDPANAKAKSALEEDKDIKAATPAEIGTCVMPKK
ncbi:MAG TPA: tetratricopeptide repeat protein, partial [Bacteroidia bacterium]|nr:tetratricopeptide repeat protein [Bacteroidia bacterium]